MDPATFNRRTFEDQFEERRITMQIVRIGLDLAKNVFEVHGVDAQDEAILRKTLRRDAVAQFFADLPPCVVGMEACCGSHYWAKVLSDLGMRSA